MDAGDVVTDLCKPTVHLLFIFIERESDSGIGDKQGIYCFITQKLTDLMFGVFEICFTRIGGIADQ
jgi:hypothetical protein